MKKNIFLLTVTLAVLLLSSTVASANEAQIENYIEKSSQTKHALHDSYAVIKNVRTDIIPEKYSKKIGIPELVFVGDRRAVQVTCPKGTTFIVRDSKGNVILKRKFKKNNMLKLVLLPKKMNGKKLYMYTKAGNKRGKVIKVRIHFVPYIE